MVFLVVYRYNIADGLAAAVYIIGSKILVFALLGITAGIAKWFPAFAGNYIIGAGIKGQLLFEFLFGTVSEVAGLLYNRICL